MLSWDSAVYIDYNLDDFCCAHRLVKGYVGPCAHLHGHNYAANIRISAESLDAVDMLIDFSLIKSVCNRWIKDHVDHATLVSTADPELLAFVHEGEQKHVLFGDDQNTTLECFAHLLLRALTHALQQDQRVPAGVILQQITVWETKRASITVTAADL